MRQRSCRPETHRHTDTHTADDRLLYTATKMNGNKQLVTVKIRETVQVREVSRDSGTTENSEHIILRVLPSAQIAYAAAVAANLLPTATNT